MGANVSDFTDLFNNSSAPSFSDLQQLAQEMNAKAEKAAENGQAGLADEIRLLLCIRLQRALDQHWDGQSPRVNTFVNEVCTNMLTTIDPDHVAGRFRTGERDDAADPQAQSVTADDEMSSDDVNVEELVSRVQQPTQSLDAFKGAEVKQRLVFVMQRIGFFDGHPNLTVAEDQNLQNLLFYGKPGTGKTMAAEAVATFLNEQLGMDVRFLPIDGSVIKHHHFGKSQKRLEALLQWADRNGPTVVFIDEIEEIASRDGHEGAASITNKLLSLTDGPTAVDDVIVIGATNRLDMCDDAIKSRFKPAIEFPLPDAETQREILGYFLDDEAITVDCPPEAFEQLHLDGFGGRDLREAVAWALVRANNGDDQISVTRSHLEYGIRMHRRFDDGFGESDS